MPIYHVACRAEGCAEAGRLIRRLFPKGGQPAPRPRWGICLTCGGGCVRLASGPSTSVVERLDNGSMERCVERPVDIHEQVEDHKRRG